MLSGKGCEVAKTARMLAQKQPPFKECVIAHWSSDLAPKMKRGSSITPKPWILIDNIRVVGERSYWVEAVPTRSCGLVGSDNAGISKRKGR